MWSGLQTRLSLGWTTGMTGETLSTQEGGNSRPTGPHQDALPQAPHQDPQLGRWQQAAEGGKGGDQDHLNLDRFFKSFL